MLRGAAVCGCNIPDTDFFAKFIAEEISAFILDFGYAELTLAEIILAFRINAKGNFKNYANFIGLDIEQISFYGNCINVDYVAKVLSNYLTIRNLLDRKLQNKIDGYEL
jgi:hypothetical protein